MDLTHNSYMSILSLIPENYIVDLQTTTLFNHHNVTKDKQDIYIYIYIYIQY